jgi:rfaE bifunctional protein nucleotidyltransferase chain/domain
MENHGARHSRTAAEALQSAVDGTQEPFQIRGERGSVGIEDVARLPLLSALPPGPVAAHSRAVDSARKLVSWEALPAWRTEQRQSRKVVVVTNGCFDILHAGHVTYLEAARRQGDVLLVGLNGDASIRQLKGPDRPVNGEQDRARVLAALECVSAVCLFSDLRATHFLELAQPDLYVKGGDFTVDQLPADERRAVEALGGRILIMPHLPGRSTTGLLARIRSL